MGNTLLNRRRAGHGGEKLGAVCASSFLSFKKSGDGSRSDPEHRRRDSHVAKRAGSDL